MDAPATQVANVHSLFAFSENGIFWSSLLDAGKVSSEEMSEPSQIKFQTGSGRVKPESEKRNDQEARSRDSESTATPYFGFQLPNS